MTRALITGATGQDGHYLASILREKGYEVHGTSRPEDDLDGLDDVTTHVIDMRNPGSLSPLIESVRPDEVYNLAALSSVWGSWQNPLDTAKINGLAVAELLAACWNNTENGSPVRVIQASSAELFGVPASTPQTEETPVRPTSPYGASKAYAHLLVGVYRARGLKASSAILYNHESPLRPETFVTRKITAGAARISFGLQDSLELGTLDVSRDWGWAPDYAEALYSIAQHEPDDFVIATGETHTIREFLDIAFARVGIDDWTPYVTVSEQFTRPVDPAQQVGDASRAERILGWKSSRTFTEIVHAMVDNDVEIYRAHASTADVEESPRA